MLWGLKLGKLESNITELNMKDIRTIRTHVQYDHATRLRWSPDSKALLAVRALSNEIEIFKVGKKPEVGLPSLQATHTLPKVQHSSMKSSATNNLCLTIQKIRTVQLELDLTKLSY